MLHPVGSQPPATYWKRRAVGIGVLVVLLFLLARLLTPGAPDTPTTPQSSGTSAGTPQLALVPATPLNTAGATPSATASGATASGATASGATASGSAASGSAAPATTSAPAAPVGCTDTDLGIAATADQPSYTSGVSATFAMSITNVSTVPCTRDLGEAQQEFLLFAGDARVWGSNDCIPGSGADELTLAPQQVEQRTVAWSGSSSDPGCASARAPLPAGDYTLRARVGTATAPDVTVTIT